jgi:hypothetical protein
MVPKDYKPPTGKPEEPEVVKEEHVNMTEEEKAQSHRDAQARYIAKKDEK